MDPSQKISTQPERTWAPISASCRWSIVGRIFSIPTYPAVLPYAIISHCGATVENARFWRSGFLGIGLVGGILGHGLIAKKLSSGSMAKHVLAHTTVALMWDYSMLWIAWVAHSLMEIFAVNRTGCRLNRDQLHGPNVLVVGNGPSAMTGDQLGDEIDQFNEVVRFNNFQNKVAGMEKWVGTKTTVHFSDGVLFPTYTEYNVPGADIVLSLFMDRFMVAGSYMILRAGADFQPRLTKEFLKDPSLIWIQKEDIDRLKEALGLSGPKHPTSGMLAIDYFLNKPGVKLPVYIHGFDFFQGPTIHYYHEQEPLYERINNNIGVNMHSPHKEKTYVEGLIREGKVCFLKDKERK